MYFNHTAYQRIDEDGIDRLQDVSDGHVEINLDTSVSGRLLYKTSNREKNADHQITGNFPS